VAQEIREFVVTVPAGTAISVPQVTNISFPERIVRAVSYRVPPGPSGVLGWALTSAGTPVIPIQPSTYIVTDNQAATWELEGYLDSGNWQVTAYNTGVYPHTVYLTFELDLPGSADTQAPPPADTGTGVVGATGTVTTAPPASTGSGVLTPPSDASGPVIATVLAAMIEQMSAAAGG